jgi:bla regulator protein blaR1
VFEDASMSNADVMSNRSVVGRSRGMKLVLRAAMVAVATPIIIGVLSAPAVRAQDATDWQTKAGGKMSFEVASVKLSKPDARQSANVPLDPSDLFLDVRTNERPNGRFSANSPLSSYVRFAYKLHLSTPAQLNQMISHLPKWVSTDVFEIQARAPGNSTKDQMRLMMQALLAERFHLAVHFETQETPVLAMTLTKPGKTGPGLRPHAEGPSCDAPPGPEIYPPACEIFGWKFSASDADVRVSSSPLLLPRTGGGRNTTMALIAWYLPLMGRLDRPVIDRTGLTGRFDFTIKWTPDPESVLPPGTRVIPKPGSNAPAPSPNPEPANGGPSFLEALREQAGLKLESTRGPVDALVIDHVERPSEN